MVATAAREGVSRLAVVAALLLAACGGPAGPPAAGPAPSGSAAPQDQALVTLIREGGRDAAWDRITVRADGVWHLDRGAERREGTLSGTRLARLRSTIADPALADELTPSAATPPVACPDAYIYRLETPDLQGVFASCPQSPLPSTRSLLDLLNRAVTAS